MGGLWYRCSRVSGISRAYCSLTTGSRGCARCGVVDGLWDRYARVSDVVSVLLAGHGNVLVVVRMIFF